MDVSRIPNPTATTAARNTPEKPPLVPAGSVAPRDRDNPHGSVDSVIVQQEFPPNTRLRLDEESNRIVAQVLDENNEVIRQLPPQELLDITARFNRLEGILFDEQR
jgi:hypothetical protein